MSQLPVEVKWHIWTFVNGEPNKNWKKVWDQLKITLWSKKAIDMEETCHACHNVTWSKEMIQVQVWNRTVEKPIKIYYCNLDCRIQHFPLTPRQITKKNKSIVFAM